MAPKISHQRASGAPRRFGERLGFLITRFKMSVTITTSWQHVDLVRSPSAEPARRGVRARSISRNGSTGRCWAAPNGSPYGAVRAAGWISRI